VKERIVITGSNGTIGSVLKEGLKEYQITSIDLPENDVLEYARLLEVMPHHNAIIHLAWDTKTDNFKTEKINPENATMFYNVYKAAIEAGVPRVIMASSVHADRFYGWKGPGYMSPERTPVPDSPYGAHKVFMEASGRYYATKGLEVVCIRFGGVNPQDKPPVEPPEERAAWFSHRDCVSLVRTILEAQLIPNNFFIVYGVSDSKSRLHDISNPLNWVPKDNVDNF